MTKYIFFIILVLSALSLRSQTVSNVTAALVNGRVNVQYNLQSTAPANCFLSYSIDGGRTFLPCVNVNGDLWAQTSGNKTISWNHAADNITQGTFFFKVEAQRVETQTTAVTTPNTAIQQSNSANAREVNFKVNGLEKEKNSPVKIYLDNQFIGETDFREDYKFKYMDTKQGKHTLRVEWTNLKWEGTINTSEKRDFIVQYENKKTGFGYRPALELVK